MRSIRHQIVVAAQNALDVGAARAAVVASAAPADNTHSDQLFSARPIRDAIDGDFLKAMTTGLLSDFCQGAV
jgi:hypothetical protein